MRWQEQKALFRKAMDLYRSGQRKESAKLFRRIIESGNRDPELLSFGGLVLATVEGDVKTGLAWCERALELAFYDPQMYINLARLHERTGWKTQAGKVLRKGLSIDPGNEKLLGEIDRLYPREGIPVARLPRSHLVNRYLGKLRAGIQERTRARTKNRISQTYS